jgi:hypothetical protein
MHEPEPIISVVMSTRPVTTGRNREDDVADFAGFWLRQQRIGKRYV